MNTSQALRPSIVLLIAFSLITGIAYPLIVTGVGTTLFPAQAHGSLTERGGKVVGSRLIGQPFSEPGHFWGRPSATSPQPNNAGSSSGSNLGPLNPALVDAVKGRIDALRAANRDAGVSDEGPVPIDLVTASASGLDPEISPEAARYQAARVAKASGLPLARVSELIAQHTKSPQLGFIGSPRVEVLALNLAVDAARPSSTKAP